MADRTLQKNVWSKWDYCFHELSPIYTFDFTTSRGIIFQTIFCEHLPDFVKQVERLRPRLDGHRKMPAGNGMHELMVLPKIVLPS